MFLNKLKANFNNLCNYRILAILFLGFSAGIPLALTGSSLSMWLSRLGIDVKTIGLFALVAIPFSFKYLWSFIFDNVAIPYFSKRFGFRKSWLILIQGCLILAIIGLGQTSPLQSITITAILAFTVSFFSATQDIIIDALRIEVLEKDEQALGASMYVYGYRIAMLVSGAGSLLLADHIAWSSVFLIMSLSILVGMIATIFLKEPDHSTTRLANLPPLNISFKFLKSLDFLYLLIIIISLISLSYLGLPIWAIVTITIILIAYAKNKFKALIPEAILDFCNRPQWLHILLFIVFYKFADTLLITVQSKFYVDMGFSNSEIAYITKGFGFMMTLFGLFVGGVIYYRLKTFNSLLLAGILQILSNLVFIWIVKEPHNLMVLSTAIAIENFTGAINNVVIVAYLSSLCNLNYTATQYALLSSLSNIGRTIMAAPAGYMVDAFGWSNFFISTAVFGIPAIILLYLMKNNIRLYSEDHDVK